MSEKKEHSNKAALTAGFTVMLQRFEAILGPLLAQYPYWELAFYEAIGLYGYYMALKQERVNEYVEFIRDHPDAFRKQIVESEEFRDGFVIAFEEYLKLRSEEKRRLAKRVFLGFTVSEDKEGFELERLDDVLSKISLPAISFLSFIKKEIFPLKESMIRSEMKGQNLVDSDEEWWFALNWKRKTVSSVIQGWLYDCFNPNSDRVKKEYGVADEWDKDLIAEVFETEQQKRDEFHVLTEELIQLGIFEIRIHDSGSLGSGAGLEYEFSSLGREFIRYLDDEVGHGNRTIVRESGAGSFRSGEIEKYLLQHGFEFHIGDGEQFPFGIDEFGSYHKRVEWKKGDPEKFPKFFELYVATLLQDRLGFDVAHGVRILKEGGGGDFDVLAMDSAKELIYVECKTGKNIDVNVMRRFYERHLFFQPALSIVVFDQPKKDVEGYLANMRSVLTDYSKSRDKTLMMREDYQYPNYEIIPSVQKAYAFHMNRNLFFCSGENIERGIRHCLRKYNGFVKQHSYWG
ncbi:MAG: restriction endonuclease [Candidatus Moranbacteria bacterium]|nr:restriction endonuclease [Candidatus Moranbacteria bacterium]